MNHNCDSAYECVDPREVTRSRPVYNRVDLKPIQQKLAGRIAAQETGSDPMDEKNHLAEVRVAGSNPVVPSRESPGRSRASGWNWPSAALLGPCRTTFFGVSRAPGR